MNFKALTSTALLCFNLVSGAAAKADEPSIGESCEFLIQFLPNDIQDIPIDHCEEPTDSQTVVTAAFTVPANRVLDVQRILISSYGMEPLRFICCGYETSPVTVALPVNHPLRQNTQRGVFRDILLSFSAPGISNKKRATSSSVWGKQMLYCDFNLWTTRWASSQKQLLAELQQKHPLSALRTYTIGSLDGMADLGVLARPIIITVVRRTI